MGSALFLPVTSRAGKQGQPDVAGRGCFYLLILAVADQPDEDKSSWTCTLFKPEHVEPPGKNTPDKVLCRIRHGQTDLCTRPFVDSRSELQLGDKDPDLEEVVAYTAMPCGLL
ncbi:hypothetical protein ACLB2K_046311 [Fragaria x ananassa]